jgi:Sedlin, N-terminal conserved region
MTTTQIKFLLTVHDRAEPSDQKSVDEGIKNLFVKMHRLYIEYLLNPFGPLNGTITSLRFDARLQELVTTYNRSHA